MIGAAVLGEPIKDAEGGAKRAVICREGFHLRLTLRLIGREFGLFRLEGREVAQFTSEGNAECLAVKRGESGHNRAGRVVRSGERPLGGRGERNGGGDV